MSSAFLLNADADEHLESDNRVFWDALLTRIAADGEPEPALRVLDVGCHRGGLLDLVATKWPVASLMGIEPLDTAREAASARLAGRAEQLHIVSPTEWASVPRAFFDLVTCHEVLYLVADLPAFFARLRGALAETGRAYVVLGCHTENPVWPAWRELLRSSGVTTYDYSPFDVIRVAASAGLEGAVRPLRRDGWARYDPGRATFKFGSVSELLEHHYRHKLLFRFVRA